MPLCLPHPFPHIFTPHTGLAVLPMGSAFPGVLPVPSLMQQGLVGKAHFFATAGERGVVRIWRSDTGACLYTYTGDCQWALLPAGAPVCCGERAGERAGIVSTGR